MIEREFGSMHTVYLDGPISKLEMDQTILENLEANNIYTINDLWNLERKDLKDMGLSDSQINQVVIKMQLCGIDLNKRIYGNN
jgi:DNA-directed RNA polymerase alpha subunit